MGTSMKTPDHLAASRSLRALADPQKARILSGFFKTGKGQYGEGDRFLGVKVPQTRSVAKRFAEMPFPGLSRLLSSPWHEERLLALLILVGMVGKKATFDLRKAVFDFYVKRMSFINNWDLVDLSAPQVVGRYLWDHPEERPLLDRWARSPRLWDRRVAVVSTLALIREGRFDETLRLAKVLLVDREDLMHKAVGWMLREVGKRDEKALLGFLDRHAPQMPRTMLRYSLERLSRARKLRYMRASD